MQDLYLAFRLMRKYPGFTAIVILTLALGIGSNATVYSAARVFMLESLPGLREPDRLMRLVEIPPQRGEESGGVSPGNLFEWRRKASAFEGIGACDETLLNVTSGEEPERIVALRGTANYFQLLGFTPILGRGFLPDEDQPGRDAVVVLSHGFWQRRYAGDPKIVGRTISLDGRSVTVIGVMPPHISFPEVGQVWVPLVLGPSSATDFADRSLIAFGRLKPGVSVNDAQAQLSAVAADVASAYPHTNAGWGIQVWPLEAYHVRDRRPFILLLVAAAAFVLLIVCANVASLLLARGSARQREFCLRQALGANRSRVFRQCLTESVLLGLFGGALGILVAYGELALIRGAVPGEITQFLPAWHYLTVDNQVLAYTAAVALLVGLVFGAGPALSASRVALQGSLKEGGWGSSIGGRGGRLRRLLVISETSLALILLASTGLMVQSFASVLKTDLGFRTDHLLTMDVTLPASRYPDTQATSAFYTELARRVEALPGVRAVSFITGLPLSPWDEVKEVEVADRPVNASEKPSVGYRVISDNYFATLEIPLLRGRAFDGRDHDQPQNPVVGVAIVNEAMAKMLWPGADPLGQRIRIAGEPGAREREVVGLARDIRNRNLINKPPRPEVYVPLHQTFAPIMALAIRTADDPAAHTGDVQRQIGAIDPTLAGGNVQVFDRILVRVMAAFRITTGMLMVFALLALVLAGLGIFGVISFATARRTQEIGIRMALGAQRNDVLGLIIRQGMWLALIGLGIGLAGALALTRAMAGILVGVSPTDLVSLLAACSLLGMVALLASYLPARRAAQLDPLSALRYE